MPPPDLTKQWLRSGFSFRKWNWGLAGEGKEDSWAGSDLTSVLILIFLPFEVEVVLLLISST